MWPQRQGNLTLTSLGLTAGAGGSGFHLIVAKPELIQSTVADIKAMKPDHIVGTHCTGFRALVALSKEMPEEFTLSTAGTKYAFGA